MQPPPLTDSALRPYLEDPSYAERICAFDTLPSTNRTACALALAGCPNGTIVLAGTQTAGRGRYDRSFYSPPGGVYLSAVLPADAAQDGTPTVTAAAAVAVCRAIEAVTGRTAQIKWVNDVLVGGKKVCGILTEGVTNPVSGRIDRLILGIGVNTGAADFPPEIAGIAASLDPDGGDDTLRLRIAAALVNTLLHPENRFAAADVYADYRARLTLLGSTVTVTRPGVCYTARAVDLDSQYRLLVVRADGTTERLSTGEVSVREGEAQ